VGDCKCAALAIKWEGICMQAWNVVYLRGTDDDDDAGAATMRCTSNCTCLSYSVSTREGSTIPYPLVVFLPVPTPPARE
jgi:hypothetical protein